MDTNVIVVKQLPVIEEQLIGIKREIEAVTQEALAMECDDATVKEVKARRAELNKWYKEFEDKRKDVKRSILAPYEYFEAVYKDCISNPFSSADKELAAKIVAVESVQKNTKREECIEYFNEYRTFKKLTENDISFDDVGLNITLGVSLKSLKQQIKDTIDKVSDDIAIILMRENSAEIMIEYKRVKNVVQAIEIVTERHKRIEEMSRAAEKHAEEAEENKRYEAEVLKAAEEEVVEELERPEIIEVEDKQIYEVTFTVTGTLDKIKSLKNFLVENEIDYTQI